MSKIATIQTQVEFELKQNVEDILQHLGLTTTQAITLFLEQIALQKDLPFEVKKPNAETRAALEEASQPEKLESYKTPEALYAELDI
jgi:DNA-damage-inducible protein J